MSLLDVRDLSIDGLLGPLSFSIEPGQKLGLIGQSGSGKSLTALAIMGLLPENLRAQGSIRLDGAELVGLPDRRMRRLRGTRVAMVFQEPMSALDPLMKIGRQLSAAALSDVGLDPALRNRYPFQLSGGQRQRVLIAMAMAEEPDLLICDEPTTALDALAQAEILEVINDLVERKGTALLFISHDLDVVEHMCPEVLLMREGKLVDDAPRRAPLAHRRPAPAPGKAIIELRDVTQDFGRSRALDSVNLTVRRGERLGIVGSSGSGKTTALRLIAGLDKPSGGSVRVEGQVQMVFQDPRGSLNPRLPVWKIVAEGKPSAGREEIAAVLQEVGLDGDSLDRYPHEFSGGQRQRISIARAIIGRPDILLADEAVSALDVAVRAQILELLGRLADSHNLTLVFISHDLGVIEQLCSTVAVIQQGRIIETGSTSDVWNNPKHEFTRKLLAASRVR